MIIDLNPDYISAFENECWEVSLHFLDGIKLLALESGAFVSFCLVSIEVVVLNGYIGR